MSFPYRPIPGKSVSVVVQFEPGDKNDPGVGGFTLKTLEQRLGGSEVDVVHPLTGEKNHISLREFEATDGPKKRYIVTHRFVPDQPVSAAHMKLVKQYEEAGKASLGATKK